jgi:flagella basal body P-ring formation protein FlgA
MKTQGAQCVVILTLLLCPLITSAQSLQSADSVRATSEQFVLQRLGSPGDDIVMHATAGQLDSRLRLASCAGPLQGELPATARVAARVTIGVSCGEQGWRVYVPVTVETDLPVLVLRQAAARDSKLLADDVELRTLRVPGLADTYIRDPAELADLHLKVAAAPGTPLDITLFAADILVKRGQRVTLVAEAGGLEVRAQGEAIGDASSTGRVRVLNLDSRRIVEGQVETRDRVRVSL